MTIERREQTNGTAFPSLVECPVADCEADLRDTKPCLHIAKEHDPEDFGLSPLGERDAEGTP